MSKIEIIKTAFALIVAVFVVFVVTFLATYIETYGSDYGDIGITLIVASVAALIAYRCSFNFRVAYTFNFKEIWVYKYILVCNCRFFTWFNICN
ncbi:MAG: hypothetical protein AAF304_04745 [Pseudomonadota bacterium]